MSEAIECHKGVPRFVDAPIEWQEKRHGQSPSPYTHCSYCGSIHFDDLRAVLEDGGRLEGADWKYGFPHKFYVHSRNGGFEKFYTEHLMDLKDPTAFTELATFLKAHTDIEFVQDQEGRVMYRAPYYGYQRGT